MNRAGMQIVMLVVGICSISGCSAVARLNAAVQYATQAISVHDRLEQSRLNAQRERLMSELEAIRQERELEMQAWKADQELELGEAKANAERDQQCRRNQTDESVRTKVGVDLEQRLRLGQLQVDMDKLRTLMAEKEEKYGEQMKLYNGLKEEQRQAQRTEQAQKAREFSQGKHDCSCSDCGAPMGQCQCGSKNYCCRICTKNIFDCSCPPATAQGRRDCAGPTSLPAMKPVPEPILPTEIPLMLPVRLELRMDRSELGTSEVRRRPYPGTLQGQKPPCQGHCTEGCTECCPPTSGATKKVATRLQEIFHPVPPAAAPPADESEVTAPPTVKR